MEMDHNALWAQITLATKMRLGTGTGSIYRSDDSLMFGIAGRKRQRFKIRLNGPDLYDITLGHLNRRTFDWTEDGQATDVDVTELNAALLRLAGLDD
jgi:hypothetical protein